MQNRPALNLRAPVFLLASERSGGNLVRAIMGAHPAFHSPAPAHYLHRFNSLLPLFGPLEEDANFQSACDASARFFNLQLADQFSVTGEHLFERARERSLIGIFDAAYGKEVDASGKARLFVKENNTVGFSDRLATVYPDCRFIYLVRDVRDVALSWSKSLNHEGGIKVAAKVWAEEQRRGASIISDPMIAARTRLIRYEDVITDPEGVFKEICDKVGVDFDPAMLAYHKSETIIAQANAVANWENLSAPVKSTNAGKFREGLSEAHIAQIEKIACVEMRLFDYERETEGARTRDFFLGQRVLQALRRFYKLALGARLKKGELVRRAQYVRNIEAIRLEAERRKIPLYAQSSDPDVS